MDKKRLTIIITHLKIEDLCKLFNLIEELNCPVDTDFEEYLMDGRSLN